MRSILTPSFRLAATVMILCGVMLATTLERLSMDQMTAKSTAIIRGTIVGGAAELQANGAILTHYRLKLAEVWKGSKGGLVDVYVPGGTAAGLRQLVPGAPVLNVGTEYLLFLWVGPSGRPQIMGLSQGLFTVTLDRSTMTTYAERPGAREAMIDPATGQPVTDRTLRMKLTDLKTTVQRSAGVTE